MNRNLMKPMALLGTLILILSLMIGCGGDPAAAVTEATAAPTETAGTISGETSEKQMQPKQRNPMARRSRGLRLRRRCRCNTHNVSSCIVMKAAIH